MVQPPIMVATKKAKQVPQKKSKKQVESEDDEEILSDELASQAGSESEIEEESEDEVAYETLKRKFVKGLNRYGTEDPILAAAEDALDNGLFDSEGNMDEEGFEGLFGSKFEERSPSESEESVESPESDEEVTDDESADESDEGDHEDESPIPSPPVKMVTNSPMVPSEGKLLLQRKLKGLLNRLSMSNFESIAVSIEAFYLEHPRRDVTETITELILTAITTQSNLLDSFVLVFASLVATLGHLVGVEFAAYLLQRLVEILTENNMADVSMSGLESQDGPNPARTVMNLVTFLSFLYDLQIVSYQIIGEVIHEAVLRLNELDAEVVLKLVRNCGAQFRRDDPATLKKIILALNERVLHIPQEKQSSRFKFMLESILDLKNNKQKTAALQGGDLETAKKLLRNMAQQRSISKFEPLRMGLEDIRNADTRGRWWLVGGTWAPEADKQKHKDAKAAVQQQNSIAALAKEQRMNTDTRKAIFSALVSSDDYVDAFQRIVALKLTSKQERDIAAVVLHCCVQEKVYNPFYALVAQRFISFRHNHLITFKYAFWDWLQQITDASLRKVSHLAKFYSFLFSQHSLPLSILKKADMLHLSEMEAVFFQMLFARLLTEGSEESVSTIFESLSGKHHVKKTKAVDIFDERADEEEEEEDGKAKEEDLGTFKAALQVFFTFYLRDKSADDLPFVSNLPLLSKRIDFVSCYLK